MQTPQLTVVTPISSQQLYEELGAAIRGNVYLETDPNYLEYIRMFNGNVKSSAKAVVVPINAEDVSRIVLFCAKHFLSPSVKAGGYGTAGWAVAGDIVIDLSKITDLDIEVPLADSAYTSLKDMPTGTAKGKGKAGDPVPDSISSGKRRREADFQLRTYDSASRVVASFLRGPPLPNDGTDLPPPSIRRRLGPGPQPQHELLPAERQPSSDSDTSQVSSTTVDSEGIGASQRRTSTAGTSPSPPSYISSPLVGADPFGYLNTSPGPLPSFTAHPTSSSRIWGPGNSSLLSHPIFSPAHNLFTQAEPIYPHAYVTFGAGNRQKEVDQYCANNPLEARSLGGQNGAIPYHIPFAAHPAGSAIMLLAGFGFMSRLRGLSIDNIVEVEIVLADGRIVIAGEKENPDLWWALRGAGTAFGIATRYKARAYPIPVVFAGNLIYRFHRATAPSLIKHFRDCIKGAPRELYANLLLTAGPAGKDSLVVIQMCYLGAREKGIEYLNALSSWEGESCLLNEVNEKNFLHQQDSVAQILRGKTGRRWFLRSALISSLPDEVVNKTVMEFADAPLGCTWLFELAGGAIADFEDTCLPKSQREASFTVAALHQWEMDFDDPRCVSSAENWIQKTLAPVNIGGPFPSFVGRHETASRIISIYGDNWSRLAEVKKKYDPHNLFRNSFWPLDAKGEIVEPSTREPPSP